MKTPYAQLRSRPRVAIDGQALPNALKSDEIKLKVKEELFRQFSRSRFEMRPGIAVFHRCPRAFKLGDFLQ